MSGAFAAVLLLAVIQAKYGVLANDHHEPGFVPFLVSVEDEGEHLCGGTILDAKNILTAAHCCEAPLDPVGMTISAGANNIDEPEKGVQSYVPIRKVNVHPGYNGKDYTNDVCVVNLAIPLNMADPSRTAPVKLPPTGYQAAGEATVLGWSGASGGTRHFRRKSRIGSATVPILSAEECQKHYDRSTIVEHMICAGVPKKPIKKIEGGSGGPLIDSEGTLIGISSWRYRGDFAAGSAAIFTEIAPFLDFINSARSA